MSRLVPDQLKEMWQTTRSGSLRIDRVPAGGKDLVSLQTRSNVGIRLPQKSNRM